MNQSVAPVDRAAMKPPAMPARITAEQIRMVYLHSPTTTGGSLACGLFLCAALWNNVSHAVLMIWMTVLIAHQALRIHHYRAYLRASPGVDEAPRWGRLYLFAIVVAGSIWGAAGVLMFVPDSIAHQAFVCLILFGIATISMASLSAFLPAIILLIPLALGPFVVRAFAEGDVEHMLLAVPALIMIGGTLSFGRRINRLVTEAISKRFENEALVTALSAQTAIAEQARATAEAANRSKTRFFAAASHDLRQPLHALGLFASALQAKVRDPEVAHMVHSINGSVEALDGLFNELLDISKIDAGVIKPVLTVFPVKHLIDRLRLDFGAEAHAMGLRFHARASGAWISSDPLLLERILRNLISNALRYTRQGGVVLGCRRRGNDLSIEVWDSGIGIAPEQIDRVFEEFYQVGNAERSSKKGLGLGLSIVKRLSGLLGASLRLRSRAGRGSVFAITLPLAAAPAVSAPAASVRASAAAGSDFSGRLMVVIDDEEAIVDGMRVLLDSWGAAVIASTDGADVIAQVHRHGRLPDLIIADYRLAGGLIGTDLIERLQQELDPAIPAILVTGSTTPERVEEATRKGYHLLLKPVTPERLRQLIRFKLDGKGGP